MERLRVCQVHPDSREAEGNGRSGQYITQYILFVKHHRPLDCVKSLSSPCIFFPITFIYTVRYFVSNLPLTRFSFSISVPSFLLKNASYFTHLIYCHSIFLWNLTELKLGLSVSFTEAVAIDVIIYGCRELSDFQYT